MVDCGLKIPSLNVRDVIFPFLLDSGSAVTVLSNYHANQLDINYNDNNNLRKDEPLSGIGGRVDAYLVENATLVFVTEENNAVPFHFSDWSFRIAKIEHPEVKIREYFINNMPSIIGRDLLLKPNIQFTYKSNEVLLEIEA